MKTGCILATSVTLYLFAGCAGSRALTPLYEHNTRYVVPVFKSTYEGAGVNDTLDFLQVALEDKIATILLDNNISWPMADSSVVNRFERVMSGHFREVAVDTLVYAVWDLVANRGVDYLVVVCAYPEQRKTLAPGSSQWGGVAADVEMNFSVYDIRENRVIYRKTRSLNDLLEYEKRKNVTTAADAFTRKVFKTVIRTKPD